MLDLWYKNAVIYCLDVETYMDGNGDGIGDFVGLTQRLDDIAGLGVTCIWLLPFYPIPNLDNGYDVMDCYSIDPCSRNPDSLLNWMERAIRIRKECPEFGWGTWKIVETENPGVFADRCEWREGVVIAVHKLANQPLWSH